MKRPEVPVSIVVGMGRNTRAIGKKDRLLWHVPDDLKRFKSLTMGHPVIMGRKTFESILAILGKPFPGRTNIVVTRNTNFQHEGVRVTHSLEEALEIAEEETPEEIHIGGGGDLYRQALPYTDKLFVTYYDDEQEGDAHFPEFEDQFDVVEQHEPREYNDITYQWVDYVRKNRPETVRFAFLIRKIYFTSIPFLSKIAAREQYTLSTFFKYESRKMSGKVR